MADEERQRPAWVWIIVIYYFGSTALSLLGFYVILGSHLPVPPASRVYFDSLTTLDWIAIALTMLCSLAGAVMLFLLRRLAPILFSAGFAITLLHTVWQLATGAPQVPSVLGMVIGFAIALAVIAYAFRLRDAGVLV